jgi:hypothetical protein
MSNPTSHHPLPFTALGNDLLDRHDNDRAPAHSRWPGSALSNGRTAPHLRRGVLLLPLVVSTGTSPPAAAAAASTTARSRSMGKFLPSSR